MRAVQLIAHGSRREQANADLVQVAENLLALGEFPIVVASYLELAEPSIPTGAKLCIDQGANEIFLTPYFLSPGRHVTSDLKRFRDELAEKHKGTRFVLCPPIGLHPLMLEIINDRICEGLRDSEFVH
jgi:sirohydrochlorin ferrochelatase